MTPSDRPTRDVPFAVIPTGASFQGILTWRGAVRVEGSLEGDAVAQGSLEIGPEARVQGNVLVDELVVVGTLQGDAAAARRIELRPGARVVGNLRTPLLVMSDGCTLEGRLETGAAEAPGEHPQEAAQAPAEQPSGPLSP